MATETQKKFREEIKKIQKENPVYFEKNDIYLKRTSSLKRKVIRNVALAGVIIILIRVLLFIYVYVVPKLDQESFYWLSDIWNK